MTPQQFEQLILTHRRPLELFAAQWTTTPEDCVQDAFLKLFRNPVDVANHRAWLFRAVRNLAIDSGRSETSRKQREQSVGQNRKLFAESNDNSLDLNELQSALEHLPDDQREVIVARTWGKLTFEEISEAFGIATSTAHRRYETGILQLQKHFEIPTRTSHE